MNVEVDFPFRFYIEVDAKHRGEAWNPACEILNKIRNIPGVSFGNVVNLSVEDYDEYREKNDIFTIRTGISDEPSITIPLTREEINERVKKYKEN